MAEILGRTAPAPHARSVPRRDLGARIVGVITTTDHKMVGNLYLTTSFVAGREHAIADGMDASP